jgi:hypothetical protein
MNLYQRMIAKATGIDDVKKVDMIEQYMRQIYFHSTLSWQTQEELNTAAIESAAELQAINWDFK